MILVQPECSLVAKYTCRRRIRYFPAGLTGLIGPDRRFVDLKYKKKRKIE